MDHLNPDRNPTEVVQPSAAMYEALLGGAEGALPNGTPVRKCNSEPGDRALDGTKGVVQGSISALPEHIALGIHYGYLVQWAGDPFPTFVISTKIEEDV
jgi:hypothetical protein